MIGALAVGIGDFATAAQPPTTGAVNAPPAGATVEYGQYAVQIAGCRFCHGTDLGGGAPGGFGPGPGPNLTAIVPKMSDVQFVNTIRSGTDPSGHQLNPDLMPWKTVSAAFDDNELKAVYLYLKSVPSVERAVPTPAP